MTATVYGKLFDIPKPGAWELDLTHFPRPATKYVEEVFLKHFIRGFAEGTKLYGLLLSHLDYYMLHGMMYSTPRPVGAPESAKGPPPKPIFKLLTWLHPEVRARIGTARKSIEEKRWLVDLKHWDDEVKPRAIREHLAIQNVDPARLDDNGLIAHLSAARRNAENAVYRHARFTMTACLPVGDYLAHAAEWTGEEVHTLLRPVKGYSSVSNGVAAEELQRLARGLRGDPALLKMLDQGSPAEVLAALNNAAGPLGAAARAWLTQVSYRIVTGYDVCDRFGLEIPETLLGSLRSAVHNPAVAPADATMERDLAALRDKVPPQHRAQFDELLADARCVYRLRDERDHYNDGWSTGLLRRAMLEAGKRLVAKGRIDSAELAVEATEQELLALLAGSGGPSNEELASRAEWRRMVDPSKIPLNLGFPPSAPPPAAWLPAHAARFARAIEIFLFGLFQPSSKESAGDLVQGIPVSGGIYEGCARVVHDAADFDQVVKGDVLIARSTSPYFNVLLPLLGAIVTDRGGALSHAAIVAREYGIPGVVGTKTATQSIKTGQRVRVDGNAGEVRVLGN